MCVCMYVYVYMKRKPNNKKKVLRSIFGTMMVDRFCRRCRRCRCCQFIVEW